MTPRALENCPSPGPLLARSSALLLACAVAAGAAQAPRDHDAVAGVRPQLRRRLLPRQLQADLRLLAEARPRVRSHGRCSRSARPPKGATQLMAIVTSPENHRNSRATRTSRAGSRCAEGLDRRAGARAREGRQGRRLDRRRPARHRSARRAAARRDGLPDGQPHRRGDDAVPERRRHPVRARQSGRQRSRRRLVHAQPGSGAALARRSCRGSTRSTSATTTTATSSRRRRPRPRT